MKLAAASFIAAFYLLARALTAIQLMSNSPLAIENPLSHQVMSWLVDGLALVLPALDRFTQSVWLADAAAGGDANMRRNDVCTTCHFTMSQADAGARPAAQVDAEQAEAYDALAAKLG